MIVNGNPASSIALNDRGLQYGDGVFTTAKVLKGQVQAWPLHVERLADGLTRLHIPFDDWASVEQSVKMQAMTLTEGVIKVVITRGEGGRGYLPPEPAQPNWLLYRSDFPEHYHDWQEQGIKLGHSDITIAKQPLLAGIKHLNRLEQVLIRQSLQDQPWQDAVVCDTDGVVVETAQANLFWCRDGEWYTPDLSLAGVAGVMRHQVMDVLARRGEVCHTVRQMPMMLSQAQSLLICNSVMGVVPVTHYLDHRYDLEPIFELQEAFNHD